MQQPKTIEHSGVIVSQSGDTVVVEIDSHSACEACDARKLCTSANKRHIDASAGGQTFTVGEQVTLVARENMSNTAVLLAYVMPLIVLVITLIVAKALDFSDAIAGLASLIVAGIYYIILSFFKENIKKTFNFTTFKKLN